MPASNPCWQSAGIWWLNLASNIQASDQCRFFFILPAWLKPAVARIDSKSDRLGIFDYGRLTKCRNRNLMSVNLPHLCTNVKYYEPAK